MENSSVKIIRLNHFVKAKTQKSTHTSGVPTEAGLLRAAALNLGLGAAPNFLLKAGRRPARIMMSGCQKNRAIQTKKLDVKDIWCINQPQRMSEIQEPNRELETWVLFY